jgi:hypothetical protein
MSDDNQIKLRKSVTSGDIKSKNATQTTTLKPNTDNKTVEEIKIPTFFKDPNRYNS